ncbi:MAG TPA: M20/M25/M40 family metallo-hydrolase, partial [Thermoanaerobaculia bacterium]|nr:M20/M25/M40 family metallo-hydrolase [Thermoanaerobaculia bacterium]
MLLFAAALLALTPPDAARVAHNYRTHHEREILSEFSDLLAIPNVATDTPNIEKNAAAISSMFSRRGATARLLRIEGAPPLVYATLPGRNSKTTIAFYAHYDGQPVDPAQWTSPPWQPVMKGEGGEARIYARSASDDKAPIMAMAAALDALEASRQSPAVNLKFVFEGEEEAGSPHLAAYFEKYPQELSADAWLICDGPVHQSRHMQLFFGARGVTDLQMTVYGPLRPLHSGHYGNWAPNPIVMLTHLIDSMRDANGHILIDGFYDDVTPLSDVERDALAAIPNADDELKREYALGRTEGAGRTLNELILQPALNVHGISGGEHTNSIPSEAHALIDFRLVPAETPEKIRERVERHIAAQDFFIVHETPDAATRMAHANVVKLDWGAGYPPARTSMELPMSRRVASVISEATGTPPYSIPSLGGSVPMYLFQRAGTPVIGFPIVNHDNNQHAANENLRLQNLW